MKVFASCATELQRARTSPARCALRQERLTCSLSRLIDRMGANKKRRLISAAGSLYSSGTCLFSLRVAFKDICLSSRRLRASITTSEVRFEPLWVLIRTVPSSPTSVSLTKLRPRRINESTSVSKVMLAPSSVLANKCLSGSIDALRISPHHIPVL